MRLLFDDRNIARFLIGHKHASLRSDRAILQRRYYNERDRCNQRPDPAPIARLSASEDEPAQAPDPAGARADKDDHRRDQQQMESLLPEAHPLGRKPIIDS